jgi:hypothetical protein
MAVWPVAERRQSDDRSYQQENHDELGIFNDEGNHGIYSFLLRGRSFTFSVVRQENISPPAGRM